MEEVKEEITTEGNFHINTITEDLRHITIIGKPRQLHVHGDNFYQFCDRFIEYVTINDIKKNLDLIFLSLVDNRTHGSLKSIALEDDEKICPKKLCKAYKLTLYPDVGNATVLAKIYSIKQQSHESIDDYKFRLDGIAEKSSLSSEDLTIHLRDAFIKGLKNSAIKFEIVRDQKDLDMDKALSIAKRLEAFFYENTTNSENECNIQKLEGPSFSEKRKNHEYRNFQDRSRDHSNSRSRDYTNNRYRNRSRSRSNPRYFRNEKYTFRHDQLQHQNRRGGNFGLARNG